MSRVAVTCAVWALVLSSSWRVAGQSTPIPVVGVSTGIDGRTGQRPARQNIDDLFARGGEQWDLYIQALAAFQAVNETDELSYFQVSGIHGLPFVAWNGVETVPGAPLAGYCPHGELLFSTWHRPFVALFEQTLLSHAATIATLYPDSSRSAYLAAAQTLRQPYWDWAHDANLPVAATQPNVTVNTPGAGPVSVRNPLYSYRFQSPPAGAGFGGFLDEFNETLRCPSATNYENAAASDEGLDSYASWLTTNTYDVFTRSLEFQQMAYYGSGGPSFEMPHNAIHDLAGCGNGTLANIPWSAFDPIFMLHHCNVDRLIALWQAIYYDDAMFNTSGVSNGLFATPAGTVVNASSPLKPFFDANLDFHTSDSVAALRTFGYTYPEIDDWSGTPEDLATSVIVQVNSLYGGTNVAASSAGRRSSVRFRGRDHDQSNHHDDAVPPSYYYTAEVQVDRAQLRLPSSFDFFLDGKQINMMTLLGRPASGVASVSLALGDVARQVGFSISNGSSVSDVVGYLRDNLDVRVRQADGSVMAAGSVASFRLDIQALEYVPQMGAADFPTFGAATRFAVPVGDKKGAS